MLEFANPSAIILMHASNTKQKVNTKFITSKDNENWEFGSLRGLSTKHIENTLTDKHETTY